jgi:nitrogen-specific signal transduction histidine kinase
LDRSGDDTYRIKEDCTNLSLTAFLLRIKSNLDICCSAKDFVSLCTLGKLKEKVVSLHQNGARQRLITEITPGNLQYCEELSGIVEIRHFVGIKGVFAIIDRKILGAGIAADQTQKTIELVQSEVTEFVEQQQYLFEMLWEKSIPSFHRIRELQEGIPVENTELVQGTENIVRHQVESLYQVRTQHDACCDKTFPASLLSSKPVWDMCLELQKKGVLFRTITEINPANIEYCKQMMTRMHLRHLSDIRGNFSIRDRIEYLGAATMREGEPPTQGIRSTARVFVDTQQYFFETLWNKAIPAEQRIREIEEGITPEVVEVLSDSTQIQDFANNLVKMASRELLIMFASINEYRRQLNDPDGFFSIISGLPESQKEKLSIRITIPADCDSSATGTDSSSANEENAKGLLSTADRRFSVHRVEAQLGTMITIIVVDRKYALVVELKDDTEQKVSDKASGLAIYSNSRAIVLSYASIFELLWTHIDLYDELKARDVAQKEFIDIAVHELRTPIQPILGLAEEIQARQQEGSEGRLLGIILRSASNLQRLADNLLDVARIQNNVLRLSLKRFDLNQLISSILADYAIDAARNKGIGLEFNPWANTIELEGDRDRLFQVISNLVQNALKFTESGQITVSSKIVGGFAEVSVKDSGRGIDPDILPRLFTKFASVSPSTGTGLGLFITKRIVEAHGGILSGANNAGELGATFTFSIPLYRDEASKKGLQP